MVETPSLSPELVALLEKELVRSWHHVNWTHFGESLRPPVLALVDSTRFGAYVPAQRRLELSLGLCVSQPWNVVVEVLKHEMAHQYAHEVLRAVDETAHGPAFQRVCERLGIDARAAGLPLAATPSEDERRVIERVAKLLALAESPNEHEAQAAADAARKLMLKHNVEDREAGRTRAYATRTLGDPAPRHPEWEHHLANLLASHFFVEVIWTHAYLPRAGRRATVIEISGTAANLDMAEYVYAYLRDTGTRLFEEKRRARLMNGKRDRDRFLAGLMQGFAGKLAAESKAQAQAGLVWVGDPALDAYFQKKHPRVHRRTFGGSGPSLAHAMGKAEGGTLVLRKPVGGGGGGGVKGLLGR